MQKVHHDLTAAERRVVRRWRLAVVGFYGSLLALIVALSFVPGEDIRLARSDPAGQSSGK
jgi:hypothetical protein